MITVKPRCTALRAALSASAVSFLLPVLAQAQSAPSSYTYATRFDASGRVTGTIAPDPDDSGPLHYAAVRNTYDAGGRLIRVETGELSSWQSQNVAPSSWGTSTSENCSSSAGCAFTVLTNLEVTYNALDQKIKEVVKGSGGTIVSVTQYSYDGVARMQCTAVRMNPAVYSSLPANACLLGPAGSDGPDRITKNVYDPAGQLLQVRKAVGTALEIADATYTYTGNGQKKYVIDAKGNKAELRYDGFDRLSRWVFPAKTTPGSFNPGTPASAVSTAGALNEGDYEAYTGDANGNRLTFRKRDGSILTYAYDALDRMTTKVVPARAGLPSTNTRSVFYGYNARSLQTYARFDNTSGEGVINVYDGYGRLTSTTANMDGQSRALSYTYDKNGNRTKSTWPDAAFVTMGFDGLDRLTSIKDSSSAILVATTYNNRSLPSAVDRLNSAFDQALTYDPVGRLASLAITSGNAASRASWSYTRNAAGQIGSEARDNDAYAWGGHVNVDRNYTTNGLNQYVGAGSAAFCYDGNGNLTADGSSVYLYDVENRLVQKRAQTNADCSSLSYAGAVQATLRYDPLGRLYETIAGSNTTRLFYDGDALVGEYTASGTLLRRYVHGNDAGADDPQVWFEGASALSANARYLYSDPRGSIVLLGDANGVALGINAYDEYGIPGSANQGRFQYTGQAWVPEIGMYYYKARIYSPTLGRFLQTDPIGYEDQINLYAYVANDPINGVDLTGEQGVPLPVPMPLPIPGPLAPPPGLQPPKELQGPPPPTRGEVNEIVVRARTNIRDVAITTGVILTTPVTTLVKIAGNILFNDSGAKAPVGRRGNPINVKPGTNKPTKIGGRDYTGHAQDQMQGRGVPPSAVEGAIRSGTSAPGNSPGTTVHTGDGVTVVTGSNGQVITVITN